MKTKKPALNANEVMQPWSGRMNERETTRPGGLLMAALLGCAEERQHTQDQVAGFLGVHYSYMNQLRNGLRKISSVSRDFSQACARYLGIPRLQVLMMAGQITAEDVHPPGGAYRSDLELAMQFICEDLQWRHLITPELKNAASDSQFAVVRLYEAATGKVLLPQRLDAAAFVQSAMNQTSGSFRQVAVSH